MTGKVSMATEVVYPAQGEGLEKLDEQPAYNHLTDTDSKIRSFAYIMLTCHLHVCRYTIKTTVLQSSNNPVSDYKTGYTTQCHADEHASFTKAFTEMLRDFVKLPKQFVLPVNNEQYRYSSSDNCLQCFDAIGWVAGRASGL